MEYESDYFKELRLSREFACEFDKFISMGSVVNIPPELMKSFSELKHHYQVEMEKNLS